MLRTLECEAAIFGCRVVHHAPAAATPVVPAPGADLLLAKLPPRMWGVVVDHPAPDAARHHDDADLPFPEAATAATDDGRADRLLLVENLGADPQFCLAVEDSPAGVDAALAAGMKVIGVAGGGDAAELGAADMVIPTLRSLHLVGVHPVLVLEVDALPGVGTFHPGQIKRR